MEQNNIESIWADGVPSKIDPKDLLEPQELLRLCIRFALDEILKEKGYTVLQIIDKLHVYPNIILEKAEKKYAVAIVPCIYPYFMIQNDEIRIGFAKAAKEKNYIPILCPIPARSIDEERAKKSVYLKGDLFQFANIGQKVLTEDEHQEILPTSLDFHL